MVMFCNFRLRPTVLIKAIELIWGGIKGRLAEESIYSGLTQNHFVFPQDMVGYNLHALQWHQRDYEVTEKEALFKDATKDRKKKNTKRKAKENLKRSMIVLT